jgi:hypothetical protein
MAIGTADVVVRSKQTSFAISCTESAKDPVLVHIDRSLKVVDKLFAQPKV